MDIILRVIYHNFLPCSSLEGIFWGRAEALLIFAVDKWELVGPPYYAPQVRSSPSAAGRFFTMPNGHSSPRRQPFFLPNTASAASQILSPLGAT